MSAKTSLSRSRPGQSTTPESLEGLYRMVGILFVVCGSVQFLFPEMIEGPSSGDSLEELIDVRIRYAAGLLGFGFFLMFLPQLRHASPALKGCAFLLAIDVGYMLTRFASLLLHNFDSSSHRAWLLFELAAALLLLMPLVLHRRSRLRDEPS